MQQAIPPDFVTTTQDDLQALAGHIRDVDPLAAKRLTMLSEALVNQPNSTGPSTTSWASRNVHEIIDIDTITERARGKGSSRFVNRMELLRNVLIVLPLTLTWLGISQAVNLYGQYSGNDSQQSFIFLWQQGFGGRLWSIFTLSSLAFVDFLLLLLIVGLTFVVSRQQSIIENDIEQDTARLRSELADALARAALCLGERQLGQPTSFTDVVMRLDHISQQTAARLDTVTQQISSVVQEFITELQEERQQRGSLSAFLQGMETITKQILNGASAIQNATTTLTASLNELAIPIQEIPVQQKELLQKARDIFTQIEPVANNLQKLATEQQNFNQTLHNALSESLEQLLTQQSQFSQELGDAVDSLNTSQLRIVQLIQQIQTATDRQQQLIQTIENEHQSQISMTYLIRDVANEMKDALKAIQAVTPELHSATVDMSKFVLALRSIPEALKAELVDPLRDYSKGADRMVNAAMIMQRAGHELQNAAFRLQGSPTGPRP
jgi:hypothetical protein